MIRNVEVNSSTFLIENTLLCQILFYRLLPLDLLALSAAKNKIYYTPDKRDKSNHSPYNLICQFTKILTRYIKYSEAGYYVKHYAKTYKKCCGSQFDPFNLMAQSKNNFTF